MTVNAIVPGRIWSEQIHERLHPDARERQAFIDANIPIGRFYITGTVIAVDGGMQRFPH